MTRPGAQNAQNAQSDQGTRSTTRSTGYRRLGRTPVTLRSRSELSSRHCRPSGRLACPCSSASSGTEVAIVYFDSSAMVKLVVEEAGSELAARLGDECDTRPGQPASLPPGTRLPGRRRSEPRPGHRRPGGRRAGPGGILVGDRPVELTRAVQRHAGQLAASHALRGADAVHLASARGGGASRCRINARQGRGWARRLAGGPATVWPLPVAGARPGQARCWRLRGSPAGAGWRRCRGSAGRWVPGSGSRRARSGRGCGQAAGRC
jgi:uncharacterized protein